MIAVFLNSFLVLILGFLGSKVGDKLSSSLKDSIMKFLAVAIMVIGIRSALDGEIVVIIVSVVLGLIISEFLGLEDKLDKFTKFIENKFIRYNSSKFTEGFLSTTILFCFGAMGIIGCIMRV